MRACYCPTSAIVGSTLAFACRPPASGRHPRDLGTQGLYQIASLWHQDAGGWPQHARCGRAHAELQQSSARPRHTHAGPRHAYAGAKTIDDPTPACACRRPGSADGGPTFQGYGSNMNPRMRRADKDCRSAAAAANGEPWGAAVCPRPGRVRPVPAWPQGRAENACSPVRDQRPASAAGINFAWGGLPRDPGSHLRRRRGVPQGLAVARGVRLAPRALRLARRLPAGAQRLVCA